MALILSDDLVLDQRNSRDFYDDPHSAENLQDHVDETTDILTDRENDPLVIIDSIVDESIKSGALPRPVDGALNVNIINVYVDVGKVASPGCSSKLILSVKY